VRKVEKPVVRSYFVIGWTYRNRKKKGKLADGMKADLEWSFYVRLYSFMELEEVRV